jgi:hypothetical protein
MKSRLIRMLGLVAGSLLLADVASATVSTIAYYRLGENDPGAVAGQNANAVTVDSGAAGVNLHQLGTPPTYSTNTGVAGSTLCLAVNGGGYTNNAPITTPSTNWGIEAWVLAAGVNNTVASNTNAPDGYAQIAYNGNSGPGGMGLYAIPGGQFAVLCGGIAVVGGYTYTTNTWTHLAAVYADGQTTFYVNGAVSATGPAPAPPANFFGIGINSSKPGGWEEFKGSIDEVRIFAFDEGAFTTNDLLLSDVPPPPQAPTILSGPTATPSGALVSGTQYFSAGTPLSLDVVVGGSGPAFYQWRTTNNVSGATNATLSFASLTNSDSGNYSVVVSNANGAVTSSVVSVSVLPAGSGLIPIAYYRLGENDPGAVAGQNADTNTVDLISGLDLGVAGTSPIYDASTGVAGSTLCIDVNGGGYGTNIPLTTATGNWGIEAWVKATSTTPGLSSDGYAQIVYNGDDITDGLGIMQNSTGQFVGLLGTVGTVGGATIVPGAWTHLAVVTTGGATTFYVNGVSTGSVAHTPLIPSGAFSIGQNPFASESFQGSIDEVRLFAVLPGKFSVSDLLLTQVPPGAQPPQVVSGPTASSPVVLGNSLSVAVVASGTAPLSYQWYQGGTVVPGATASSFTLTNVTTAASGGYDVVLTNLYGSKTSSVVNVTVLSAGASSVVPLAYYRLGENDPGAVAGQPADTNTIDIIGGVNLSQLGNPPIYDTNTGVAGSTLCIDVDGGGYTNSAPIPTPVNNWGIEAWVLADSTTNSLSSDGYAQIAYNGNSGPGGMGLYAAPGGQYIGLCGGIAVVGGAPVVAGKWTHLAMVVTGGKTSFYVNGVLNATGPQPAVPIDFFGIGINSSKPGGWEQFQGSIDEVRVFGVVPGKFSVSDLLLTEVPPGHEAPEFVSEPTSSSPFVATGGNVSIGIVISGTAPLSYQWYQGGGAIFGQTNATLDLTDISTSASGGYHVVITNQYGATTSSVVNVTVLPAGVNGLTPIAYYRLGENDPGAVAGQTADTNTIDIIGGFDLSTIGNPSTYSSNTGVAGSTLSLAVNAGGYTNVPIPLTANWGIEAWVYSTSATSTAPGEGDIAFNGNYAASGGMGLFQYGTTWNALVSGIAWITGPPVVTNTWTHLAVVTTGGATTFYVNGVASGTGPAPAPVTSVGDFSIGFDANPYAGRPAYFQGLIDEVRVFSVTPGLFSTNDLLLASAPPTLTVGILPAGTNMVILWSGTTLQQADSLNGPWTTITNATAPWLTPITGAAQFFRAAGQP